MGVRWRAAIRAGIWLFTALIALYPVCHAVHMRPTLDIVGLAAAANNKLLFRDFFFVMVVLVCASFGNILYGLTRDATPEWFRGASVLICLYYLYVLIYGVGRFAELTELTAPIASEDLIEDLRFMAFAGVVTFAAELAISLTERGMPVTGWGATRGRRGQRR